MGDFAPSVHAHTIATRLVPLGAAQTWPRVVHPPRRHLCGHSIHTGTPSPAPCRQVTITNLPLHPVASHSHYMFMQKLGGLMNLGVRGNLVQDNCTESDSGRQPLVPNRHRQGEPNGTGCMGGYGNGYKPKRTLFGAWWCVEEPACSRCGCSPTCVREGGVQRGSSPEIREA